MDTLLEESHSVVLNITKLLSKYIINHKRGKMMVTKSVRELMGVL